MNIALHINQLLYTSNYVVIPEFGGFVCQEFRSEINPATQMFVPPTKRVSFQPALIDHDNSLIRLIAEIENISIESAKAELKLTVSKWLLELSEGNHVKLEGIGRIYKDQNGDFGFQADVNANYDTSSFGLGIFRFPALQEEKGSTRNVLGIASSKRSNNGLAGIWKSAAVLVGVVGLLYLGTQKTDFDKLNFAGINPMIFSKSVPYTPAEENIEAKADTKVIETEDLNNEPVVLEKEEILESITKDEVTPEIADPINLPFHIIVGAFKVEENAIKLQNSLHQKGYGEAAYFYEKGFYRLSINQFDSRTKAVELLKAIQKDVQKTAWIYSK